jgi:hypothetical protein
VPIHDEEPFFRGWQPAWQTYWPSPTQEATHTEIYEDRSGEKIAIFRGMPRVDPQSRIWLDRGRTAAGVRELHQSPHGDRFRLFVLPDGTWVSGWGMVALRLAGRFASEASASPRMEPKAGALFVQEFVLSPGAAAPSLSTALLRADQILGVTVATFAAGRGDEVPVTLDIVYPSSDLARAARLDLASVLAASRPRTSDPADAFFRRAALSHEGNALVIRSALPHATFARWTRVRG